MIEHSQDWQHDPECASRFGRALGRNASCDCGDCPTWNGNSACDLPYQHDGEHVDHLGEQWPQKDVLDPEPWETDGAGTRYRTRPQFTADIGIRWNPRHKYVQDERAYEWREVDGD